MSLPGGSVRHPRGRRFRHGAEAGGRWVESAFGGPARTRVIVILGGVLALSSADTATVGASATSLRHALGISNTDIGLLVAVNALVAAVASVPFGMLADRVRRTRTLGLSVMVWSVAMVWSATVNTFGGLLLTRLFLGLATAAAGPVVASMLGDWFASEERGRIYSYVLTGELLGAGVGFAVTGDIAALSWRLAFVILAFPALLLGWAVLKLPEPVRGGRRPLVPGAVVIPNGPPRRGAPHERGAGAADEAGPAPGTAPGAARQRETDAQRVSREKGVNPHPEQVLYGDPARMGIVAATRYILSIRTNVIMIIASACGYFYLSGVQTFGSEMVRQQYGVNQALANLLILGLGVGAVLGVLTGGRMGDLLLTRGFLNGRIFVAAGAATLAALMFVPALLTSQTVTALPYLAVAAFALSAQNPALDAARLDIMPPALWGRAEGVRTLLRTAAQSLAPLLFGSTSDIVFGGGHAALHRTFLVMLLPLFASGLVLFRAMGSYPRDVATAAAAEPHPGSPSDR